MTIEGFGDIGEARLTAVSEAAVAAELRGKGHRVHQHRGRWWLIAPRRYCQPVHTLARLTAHEASPPHPLCWSFMAPLVEDDAAMATGSMPIHLLADVQGYDPATLSSDRRDNLRQSRQLVRYVQIQSPDILVDQGYEVFRSAIERMANPYRRLTTKEVFVAELSRWFQSDGRILIGGLVDGRLGGYLAAHAVGSTAYIDIVEVATDVLETHISTGLHAEFIDICRRSPEIREIAHSLHEPENPALGIFKHGIGFPVVHVPTRVRVAPPLALLLQQRSPHKFYRFTGRIDPELLAAETSATGGGVSF